MLIAVRAIGAFMCFATIASAQTNVTPELAAVIEGAKKEGVLLKKGDLLNLSGFMPAFVPIPGQRIELNYVGMPGDPAVTVEFN